jgi:sulfur-oxidizing protein SoxZ
MTTARVIVPERVRQGEAFEIKALIQHPMETGFRTSAAGDPIARDIITRFTCRYDGEEVFAWELHPGVAANPFVAFYTLATRSGDIEFVWTGMNGFEHRERRRIVVVR